MSAKKKKDGETPEQDTEKELPEQNAADTAPEKDAADKQPAQQADPLKEANDKYLRLMAEYDNYRKRSARERDSIYADVRVDTVTKFLPVYDNLERALAAPTEDEAFRKGVEMTFTQLQEIMKKLGVEAIEAVGKTFDPEIHNAVMHVQDEALGENIIVEEFQKGFRLGDKVIRFSMVKVAN